MKIFAEYTIENGISYRKTTLLQIGNSWDLIGSAVLKNPGSAKPIRSVTQEEYDSIDKFFPCQDISKNEWFCFSPDSTMGYLKKIFDGSYLGDKKEINGVIQLFNLFYIVDPNIQNANLKAKGNNSEHLSINADKVIPLFKDKPVFLGWRFEYCNHPIRKMNAQKIFDHISQSKNMYLESDMIDNHFYHPGYININHKTNLKMQETLSKFSKLFG